MPSLRQKLATKRILENPGSVSKIMREVGYAPNTAKNPKDLTESLGFKQLMEGYLPEEEVFQTHQKLLHATKIHGSLTEPDREVDDNTTQARMVEMAHKLRGRLKDKVEHSGEIGIPILGVEVVQKNDSDTEDPQPRQAN